MDEQQRWLPGVTALLGAWVFASAFLFQTPTSHYWNSIVVGAAVVLLGAYAFWSAEPGASDRRYATGLAALLGLWTIVAPFAFGIETGTTAFWSDIAAGVLVAVIAGYDAYEAGSPRGTPGTERETA